MHALDSCAALLAWMCESMDGAAFVASDVRSVNLLTTLCLTGCCMVDPQRAHFASAVLPAFQALSFISPEARSHAVHAAVGGMVALTRLISSEMLLSKSITDDALLLSSWRLAQSTLTLQHPANVSLSGPDKMNRNFLDVMYVTKFSQVSAKSAMAASFQIEDSDTQICSAVQASPSSLRQVALTAYFENILSIKDVRKEHLQLAENKSFARDLGESCGSELRGLLCALGWGVVSSLRIKGNVLTRLRELFTPHLVAAGYRHTAFVPLQNVERFLSNPQHSILGEFAGVLLQWRRSGNLVGSFGHLDHTSDAAAPAPDETKGDFASLSLQCVVSVLSPVLAGDNNSTFKTASSVANLASSIQCISRYIHCSSLFRTRRRLIAAANKIKYSAKRAVFNRYVALKLLAIVRASQPESIWPSDAATCISWGTTAADIAESAVTAWQTCRRHVKRMSTTTDRLYQGRTRLSMRANEQGSGRSMVYTVPEKSARGAEIRSWNISSSESEDGTCGGESDDSCDSLAGMEKEELLDGTSFLSSRMHLVSELPINAFTSNSSGEGYTHRGCAAMSDGCDSPSPPGAAVEVLDLSHAFYIQKQLQAPSRWGSQNLLLKSQWLQWQVLFVCVACREQQTLTGCAGAGGEHCGRRRQ